MLRGKKKKHRREKGEKSSSEKEESYKEEVKASLYKLGAKTEITRAARDAALIFC